MSKVDDERSEEKAKNLSKDDMRLRYSTGIASHEVMAEYHFLYEFKNQVHI